MVFRVLTKEPQNNGKDTISVGQPVQNIKWLMIENIQRLEPIESPQSDKEVVLSEPCLEGSS